MDNNYMNYNNIFLGTNYTEEETTFCLWAPTAKSVKLNTYKTGDGDSLIASTPMNKEKTEDGTEIWKLYVSGDLNGVYYTFSVCFGDICTESHDPFAVACGVNGDRSMGVNLSNTNPDGFLNDVGPRYKNKTDIVVMEFSVADATGDDSSNIVNKGKYLGLVEQKIASKEGIATGLDYFIDMGVTHVQIMPSYDFARIDEANLDKEQYNWGYVP